MPPRLFIDEALDTPTLTLPPGAARHVQVLRLQPGSPLVLFDGRGGEWSAVVARMAGRSEVTVELLSHAAVDRELPGRITLAVGMPANERMDGLIEKATELGAAVVQPLMTERSVLRLTGERAAKKVAHWRGVAIAASEQSGRTRVPAIEEVMTLAQWLSGPMAPTRRFVLSVRDATPWQRMDASEDTVFLSGPEGGLTEAEEAAAKSAGFQPVSLGPRVLRADTAPLAALAVLAAWGMDAR